MLFNFDPNKQANEVIFSILLSLFHITYLIFPLNLMKELLPNAIIRNISGIILDSNLNFNTHIDQKIKKCNKLIGLLRTLSVNLPRSTLLTICKSFIRPPLAYGNILCGKPNNENFQNKIEKVQYRACLAITGTIQRTSREKSYEELGLYSLAERRWRSKLIFFYKIVNHLLPDYLYSYLDFYSQENDRLRSALTSSIRPFPSRTKLFKKNFFPYCIN